MTLTSGYMNLVLPTVSGTPGPDWASELNTCLQTIDAHDHTAAKGVKVPVAGLNINADLSMVGYNLTTMRSVRLQDNGTAITGASDLNVLHCAGGNLYYRDGSGNQIQLTVGGALNASSVGGFGGDYATSTASAFYTTASKTFTFWQSANTPAILDCGTIKLRKVAASGYGISLTAASGISGDYTLTLPAALPVSALVMQSDSSGNISFSNTLASVTITGAVDFSSGSINAGSANKVIAAVTTVTGVGANVNGAKTSSDGVLSGVTITRTGRPVMLILVSGDTGTDEGYVTGTVGARFNWKKAGARLGGPTTFGSTSYSFFAGACYVDTSSTTGSATYGIGVESGTLTFNNCKLLVVEL